MSSCKEMSKRAAVVAALVCGALAAPHAQADAPPNTRAHAPATAEPGHTLLPAVPPGDEGRRNVLWRIVHDLCVPAARRGGPLPSPCIAVDERAGYILMKDQVGVSQFLLLPTTRVTGMEDAAVLAADSPDYWKLAWDQRHYVDERLHTRLTPAQVSLAVNPVLARTQDQLHFHIDCISGPAMAALSEARDTLSTQWKPMAATALAGFRARFYDGQEDPFKLLDENLRSYGGIMLQQSMLRTAVDMGNGQYRDVLLVTQDNGYARPNAEQLQDHECRILKARDDHGK
jgi:CDP-diacylglycerol pyrophosphatase